MKKQILMMLLLVVTVSGYAQEKKWEHHLHVSGGLLIDREWEKSKTGVSMNIGYGLNYYFSEHWSLMAGLDIRRDTENFFSSVGDGGDTDDFTFLDIPLSMQYHVDRWSFGLGPVFSFCVSNDSYYIDSPNSPYSALDGKEKIKSFYVGLQPSVKYRLSRYFLLGIDGQFGLQDVNKSYDLNIPIGHKYLHNIVATFGVVF